MAVFGLVFSKLAMLVITPDPLPFSKDTPADNKGRHLNACLFFSCNEDCNCFSYMVV